MSIEMQTAFEKDNTIVMQKDNGEFVSDIPKISSPSESSPEIIPDSIDSIPKVDLNSL